MATLTPSIGGMAAAGMAVGAAAGTTATVASSAGAGNAGQEQGTGSATSGYEVTVPKLDAQHPLIAMSPRRKWEVWRYTLAQLSLLSLAPFGLFAIPNSQPKNPSDTSLAECERALHQILMAPTPSWRATELSGLLRVLGQIGHWALFLRAVEESFAAAREVSESVKKLTIHRHLAQEIALALPTTLEEIPSLPVRRKLVEIVDREMPGAQEDALYLNHLTTVQQTLAGWDRVTNGTRPQLHAVLADLATASPPVVEGVDHEPTIKPAEPLPVDIVWQQPIEDESRLIRIGYKTQTMTDWIARDRWLSRGKTAATWLGGVAVPVVPATLAWTMVHPALGLAVGMVVGCASTVVATIKAGTPTDVRTVQKNKALEHFIRGREFAEVMSNWYGLLIDTLTSREGIPLNLETNHNREIAKEAAQRHMQSGGAYRYMDFQQRKKYSFGEITVFVVVRDVSWQEVLDASVKEVDGKTYDLVQFMEMAPFWRLAQKGAQYTEILPAIEKRGRKWSSDDLKILRDLQIRWSQDSVLTVGFVPTVEWLAARGNESIVRWVHGHAKGGVKLAQEAFQKLLAANNSIAVELLAETHDAGKVSFVLRKPK